MKRNRLFRVLKIGFFGILAVGLVTFATMSLWNILMPGIFALRTITFWQALGLLVLSKILFGGFRPSGGGTRWRHRMMERWERMTPEEREKFKQGMRRNCGPRQNVEVPNREAEVRA